MFKKLLWGFAFAMTVTNAAYAGPNDGIRPGPSAPSWLQPTPPRAPYALTGQGTKSTVPPKRSSCRTRMPRQIGNKVTIDSCER